MPFEQKEIQGLIVVEPEKARKRILAALEATGMHMGDAAKKLGCSHATLLRWIERLALSRPIESLKARAIRQGWHHDRKGGRPKGSTVANGAAPRGSKVSDRSDN